VTAILAFTPTSVALAGGGGGQHGGGHFVFMKSAVENADFTKVTLPLFQGRSATGDAVWYVITEASTRSAAAKLGVNYAPKLANSANGHGSQKVTVGPDGIVFTATVDFAPHRFISIGDYGDCAAVPILPFGHECFVAGAVGEAGYSPLIELPDGTVLNASHVRNRTGKADKATLNGDGTVTIDETQGRALGRIVYYISLDVSVPPGAVLENATFAPLLGATPGSAPGAENANHTSAREGIIAFTNGQTGLANPNRQGLNSTILDGPAFGSGSNFTEKSPPVPLNILQQVPNGQADPAFPLYSPLWDVHFTTWQVPLAQRVRQSSFAAVQALAAAGTITNPGGGAFGPSGPVANCPIISIDPES